MKQTACLLLVIVWWCVADAQQAFPYPNHYLRDSVNQFTTKQQREEHRRFLVDSVIKKGLRQPLNIQGIREWHGAFWAMELLLYKDAFTQQKLVEAWKQPANLPDAFQKALLEVSYTLYPKHFQPQVNGLMQKSRSVPVFVRCAEYLLRANPLAAQKQNIRSLMQQRFAGVVHPGLSILEQRLSPPLQPRPSFQSLFAASFLPGKTVIFSLQRDNRNIPGLVIIRKGDGSFVKDANGQLFHATQLARAITNYPFYITNGNTPQGIFRWTGFGQTENSYIGPTTNLQMVMPFEAIPAQYFTDSTMPAKWNRDLYATMLPAAWQKHPSLWEAYQAGEMGRSEIIMHGTAIDPSYYASTAYFPQTPSLGCLCSYEEWDAQGRLKKSEQQKIVDALGNIGASEGYVVVVNISNTEKPVTVTEVNALLKLK